MSADVVMKEIAPVWIVSIRETIANYPSVGELYPKILAQIGSLCAIGLPLAIWHDMELKEKDVDAEAGFFLDQPLEAMAQPKCTNWTE